VFKYPFVLQIWVPYLTKFVGRFGGTKVERARDLFEQALDGCPAGEAHKLFLLYAKFEEEHGLVRNAMSVYDRAVSGIALERRFDMFGVYIAKAAEYFGVTKTRDIYEQSINLLAPPQLSEMCLRYANLERKLGEIDRARAIYMHGAQDVNPTGPSGADAPMWATWHDFEVSHGNEDTFREMLRIKRSVKATFQQVRRAPPPLTRRVGSHAPAPCCPAGHGDERPRREAAARGGRAGLDGAARQAGAHRRRRGRAGAGGRERRRLHRVGKPPSLRSTAAHHTMAPAHTHRIAPHRTRSRHRQHQDVARQASFAGARRGFIFKLGSLGQGYYRDILGGYTTAPAADADAAAADEEINSDDDLEEDGIAQKPVPSAVFGLESANEPMGAMERFKRKQEAS
jgi:hypothetical protein